MKKKCKFKGSNPRHFWLLVEFHGTREPEHHRLFCTPALAQSRLENAATKAGVDVAFLLKGSANPLEWNADDIVNRCEPVPFTEFGVKAIKIVREKSYRTRQVGQDKIQVIPVSNPDVHTSLGRWN